MGHAAWLAAKPGHPMTVLSALRRLARNTDRSTQLLAEVQAGFTNLSETTLAVNPVFLWSSHNVSAFPDARE
jgi:hypothetical protein